MDVLQAGDDREEQKAVPEEPAKSSADNSGNRSELQCARE